MNKSLERKYYKRFLASWGLMIVLFWGLIGIYAWVMNDSTEFSAATRRRMRHQMESVWRYTGDSLKPGEVLRTVFRPGNHAPSNAVRLVAYLGDKRHVETATPFYLSERIEAHDILEYYHADLPPWPKDKELWVGIRFQENAIIWIERGNPDFLQMDAYPLQRSGWKTTFQKTPYRWIPGFSCKVVQEQATVRWSVFGAWFLASFFLLTMIPIITLTKYRRWYFLGVIFYTTLFIKAIEAIAPSQWWWGSYYLNRIGDVWFWIGMVLLSFVLFPPVTNIIESFTFKKFTGLTRCIPPRFPFWTGLALLSLVGVCFAIYHPSIGIYGDAYGSLASPGYDYHNPFATASYHLFRDFITLLKTQGWLSWPYGYANYLIIPKFIVLWIPVYLVFSALIARELARSRREAFLYFLILLFLKATLCLYGYIEVYGPVLALQSFLIWIILRSWKSKRVIGATSLSFFNYLFHLSGALVLPAVFFLWGHVFLRSSHRLKWSSSRILVSGLLAIQIWLLCLGTLFIFKHEMNPTSFINMVPAPKKESLSWLHGLPMLYGSTGKPSREVWMAWKEPTYKKHFYAISSKEHFSQISEAAIFMAGPTLLLLIIGSISTLGKNWKKSQYWGIIGTAALFTLSLIFLATNYPYPKDWDLLTPHASWWLVALFWLLSKGGWLSAKQGRWLLMTLLFYLIWDTLPWIFYNLTWGPPPDTRFFVFL